MENKVNGKSALLLNSLLDYYSQNMQILTYIVIQKNAISLRVLDWLVTNYAKKNNIIYIIKKNNENINFNIYIEYKNQLKAYSKKLFDPFCRRERIIVDIETLEWEMYDECCTKIENKDENKYIITTVGQLNFFKWFIENNILNYAIENIEKIDKDMTETLYKSKQCSKRKELSICASKSIYSYDMTTTVNFN